MQSKTVTYNRPWLAEYQRDAFFNPARYSLTEATTKAGKTVGGMAWIVEKGMSGRPGDNCWWVAPVYSQAKIAFRRMKDGLTRGAVKPNESELFLELLNGVRIWFKGADNPDTLYGENVIAAVIDEGSRVKEKAWHAVRSTLTQTRGPVRIIGNVKGRRNWFYKLCRLAEHGEPNMHYSKITAHDAVKAGILNAEEIADAERMLPADVFRQLYLAEPSDDEGNPFGISAITACAGPLVKGTALAHGIDLAKSVDWTVNIGMTDTGNVCHFDRWQAPWEVTLGRILAATHSRHALVDSTGVGDPVLEALQKAAHGRFEGYKFTPHSKQQLMDGLAVAIQQRKITYPEGIIVDELESVEYVYTRTGVQYLVPEGSTDDCVMALALCVRCLNIQPRPGTVRVITGSDGVSQQFTFTPEGVIDREAAAFFGKQKGARRIEV